MVFIVSGPEFNFRFAVAEISGSLTLNTISGLLDVMDNELLIVI